MKIKGIIESFLDKFVTREYWDYHFFFISIVIALFVYKYLPINLNTSDWIQLFLGYVALVSSAYAILIGDSAKRFRERAIPDIELNFSEPDCHLTTSVLPISNQYPVDIATYYLRFRILNKGHVALRNSEVILEKIEKDGAIVSKFLPLTLTWAATEHQGDRSKIQIPQDVFRTIDLIEIKKPSDINSASHIIESLRLNPQSLLREKGNMSVCSVVKPNTFSYILEPGNYTAFLTICSENSNPFFAKLKVHYDGEWSDDTETMFTDHLAFKIIEKGTNKNAVFDL